MEFKVVRTLFVLSVIFVAVFHADAQQKFIASASGGQAVPGNSSTRRILADVSINPPSSPGNAANLVFRGRGGTPFPDGSTAILFKGAGPGQTGGVLHHEIGFAPDSSWLASFDVSQLELEWLRQNRWYVQVNTPDFPGGELRGQFHLANGVLNDHDGDGRSDITVYRSSTSTYFVLHSSNGGFVEQQIGQPGDNFAFNQDFDGDGRADFLTGRYTPELIWRVLPSTTNILQQTHWGNGMLGDLFASADFDGDARIDIAVFRAGVWHILRSSDGGYSQEYWGMQGDLPAATDFDGDHRADVTIIRDVNGNRVWYTRLSITGHIRVTHWGLTTDGFASGPMDFDGDSIPDLVVDRVVGANIVFYILRSSDSQIQAIPWGLPSDRVRLGDYDGDGRTDLTVTRAVNGQRQFIIQQSSNGQVRYETFGLAGDF